MRVWRGAGSGSQFQALLSRLLVKEAVGEPFLLQNLIVPVALVDPPTLTATLTPMVLGTPASQGELTAPLAAATLADTGQLAAGDWNVLLLIGLAGTASAADVVFRRRDAANAVNVWSQRFGLSHGTGGNSEGNSLVIFGPLRVTLLVNERLNAAMGTNAGAGAVIQANIWTQGPF